MSSGARSWFFFSCCHFQAVRLAKVVLVYLAGSWTKKKLHEDILAKLAIDALIYIGIIIYLGKSTGKGLEDLSTYYHEFAITRNVHNIYSK